MKKEAELQVAVLQFLKARGIEHWRVPVGPVMRGGGKSQVRFSPSPIKGHPDIAGVLKRKTPGRYFVLELKRPKGKVTPEQVEWLVRLQLAGAACALIRSLDDLFRVMREWGEIV